MKPNLFYGILMNKSEGRLDWDYLHDILIYDQNTGIFTNSYTRNSRAIIGRVAGTMGKDGYYKIRIDGIEYKSHRLAWFYEYAEWPKEKLDHIDKIRSNNKLDNLREATSSQNNCNRNKKEGCSSEYKGVYLNGTKWLSSITFKGNRIHLGMFIKEEEAAAAYNDAAIIYHGEFAHLNVIKNKT